MVSLVNSYSDATSRRWHRWEIDSIFARELPPGWRRPGVQVPRRRVVFVALFYFSWPSGWQKCDGSWTRVRCRLTLCLETRSREWHQTSIVRRVCQLLETNTHKTRQNGSKTAHGIRFEWCRLTLPSNKVQLSIWSLCLRILVYLLGDT